MFFDDNGLRYDRNRVRWLCPCGEGTGVDAEDENPDTSKQWVVATPFNILSSKVSFREHVRRTHHQLQPGAQVNA